MEYRQYLTHNADEIIANDQYAALGNCKYFTRQTKNTLSLPPTPILYTCVNTNPPTFDDSDLKQAFLTYYRKLTNMFSPTYCAK